MAWSNKKAFEQMVLRKFGYGTVKRDMIQSDGSILTRYLSNEMHVASWSKERGGWME